MLPFEDPRWTQVSTFYDDNLASVVREWSMAVGFDRELDIYRRLFNLYLHQNTITNSAFVVVPYVCKYCQSLPPNEQACYLIDIATVEYCRLRHGCWDRSLELDWAMESYRDAIETTSQLVENVLSEGIDPELDIELRILEPVLHGNLELAIERQAQRDSSG